MMRCEVMTLIEELEVERERLVKEFINSMNDWLTEFNRVIDKLMERDDA